jgi:phage shock protein A
MTDGNVSLGGVASSAAVAGVVVTYFTLSKELDAVKASLAKLEKSVDTTRQLAADAATASERTAVGLRSVSDSAGLAALTEAAGAPKPLFNGAKLADEVSELRAGVSELRADVSELRADVSELRDRRPREG